MFRVFLTDEVLDKIRILFGNIRNIAFESDFLEIAEVCGEELRGHLWKGISECFFIERYCSQFLNLYESF